MLPTRSSDSDHGDGDEPVRGPDYRLAARENRPSGTRVRVGGVVFGGAEVVVMAGPCAVEGADQIELSARRLAAVGIPILRGGALKPRTSPYAFQGIGVDGYRLMREAADRHGLAVVSEVLSERHVEDAVRSVDLLQVGSRNMQNFALLKELAQCGRPVLLKRGMAATCDELLAAAEYLLAGGNDQVVLCERGIRTFETSTRNTLDIAAVPVLRRKTHLPIVIDPSHAAGRSDVVPDLARAAIAAGADGLLIEVHESPVEARSDGEQALVPDQLPALLRSLDAVARAVGRKLAVASSAAEAP